jgi:hypothetical protein
MRGAEPDRVVPDLYDIFLCDLAVLQKTFKGIVSPDWKGLHMFSLDRFEV